VVRAGRPELDMADATPCHIARSVPAVLAYVFLAFVFPAGQDKRCTPCNPRTSVAHIPEIPGSASLHQCRERSFQASAQNSCMYDGKSVQVS
jgi:hypothetical protein